MKEPNVIFIPFSAAWGLSGARHDDFSDLVRALADAGHLVHSGRDIGVMDLKTLAILTGAGRLRRRGRRGAR